MIAAHSESITLDMKGTLDVDALRASLDALVARHEALRSMLGSDGQTLLVDAPFAAALEVLDWTRADAAVRDADFDALVERAVTTPFDLHRGPLFRASVVRLAADTARVVFTAHHAVCDGWSLRILVRDWAALYTNAVRRAKGGEGPQLPPPTPFREYTRALARRARDPQTHATEAWWVERFAGELPVLELPLDHARPTTKTYASRRVDLELPVDLVTALKALGTKERSSLFVTLYAAFDALLFRLSGQTDLVVGMPAAGQAVGDHAEVVGQCATILPIRAKVDPSRPFRALLADVRNAVLDASEHQELTFSALLAKLPLPRDPSRLPLVSVLFDVDRAIGSDEASFEGLHTAVRTNARRCEEFELVVNAIEGEGRVALQCQYNSDLFDASTIERWLAAYAQLLRGVVADPACTVGKLPILAPADLLVLDRWNEETRRPRSEARTVAALIERQVAKTPDAVAVVFEGQELRYRDLDGRANALARRLRECGVGPGVLVGLAVERSNDMLVGVLGILKAGGAYVPLDPGYPPDRLAFMVHDSAMRVLVTETKLRSDMTALHASASHVVCVDDFRASAPPLEGASSGPEDPAYVIYTSGSTGKPKGVLVPNRSAVNLLASVQESPGMSANDIVLAVTTLSFDIALSEVVLPLTVGAKIVLASREVAADGTRLLELLHASKATFLDATPATWRFLLAAGWSGGEGLTAICTGEAMPRDLATELVPRCKTVWNGYGPTETTVWSTFYEVKAPASRILIGKPVANTLAYVLDAEMQRVPIGVTGELWIGGDGVSLGYHNRPELTTERFVADPFAGGNARMYRTGDLVRFHADGNLECLGRNDGQVKLRGYRIELGEIENALGEHPAIKSAAAIVREDRPGDPRLVGYIVFHQGASATVPEIREHLKKTLPDHMVPQTVVKLDVMPLTPSGKIDRKALPTPSRARPDLGRPPTPPSTDRERALCALFAETLALDEVGAEDRFFELGGDSLMAMSALVELRERLGVSLSAARFVQHGSPRELDRFLSNGKDTTARIPQATETSLGDDIAIVGMAGRFPGANDVATLWKNVCAGVASTTRFDDDLDPSVPKELRDDPQYVRARGIIADYDKFDADFFAVSPKDAELMDPQHRIFLETTWEALEHAGYVPETLGGVVGVFAGSYGNTYLTRNVLTNPELEEALGAFALHVVNEKDYVATRVAHKLDFTGPAYNIQTACSTSLVAVVNAFWSLRTGQCDVAIAGAASVTCPVKAGYVYLEGGMLSPDSHTRSFDAEANGTSFNDGAAIVVLKRLSDATRDGDTVYGVIRGAAINNDGSRKASFTAPSVDGQVAVIRMAQTLAGVDPRTIGYVETHGTATPIGDPIEIEALTEAFRATTEDKQFCAVSSIKSNVGHLVAAAGTAGLIKVALSLTHERIPPTAHFTKPNPKIDFASSPFFVADTTLPWPRSEKPRRAGISSFGVGGTNAHLVVEEAPAPLPRASGERARPRHLLVLSARTEAQLDAATARLASYLEQTPDADIADVAFTLQTGRRVFAHRRTVAVADAADAQAVLASKDPRRVTTRHADASVPAVVFMFTGQGSQYVGMGHNLYDEARGEPLFRKLVDRCAEALLPHLGRDLREVLDPGTEPAQIEAAAALLRQTSFTQPALFTLEYALASVWLSWGIEPAAMVGHSIGEFVCAVLAGVMSLDDALLLVANRGRLMDALPSGTMLSVRLPPSKLVDRLGAEMSIASHNGPTLSVVAGPHEAVQKLAQELEAEGVVCKPLHTSHAFHSPMMEPAIAPFEELVRGVKLSRPRIPFVSTVTATWITDEEATSPRYWARQIRECVRFADSVAELWKDPSRVLLEVGPRGTLAVLARQQVKDRKKQLTIASLGDTCADDAEWTALLSAMGQLWQAGVVVDWSRLHAHAARRRVPLPTYPFERRRHWIEPGAAMAHEIHDRSDAPLTAASSTEIPMTAPLQESRTPQIAGQLKTIFEQVSGLEITDPKATFLELGLDSLLLTQVALNLNKTFKQKITFRQLLEEVATLDLLAEHIDKLLPRDAAAPVAAAPAVAAPAVARAQAAPPIQRVAAAPVNSSTSAGSPFVHQVIEQQMRLMAQQLELLSGGAPSLPLPPPPPALPLPLPPDPVTNLGFTPVASPFLEGDEPPRPQIYDPKKAFGAIARIHTTNAHELTPQQAARLDALTKRYNAKTKGSKSWTQDNRSTLSDPRVVTGFRPQIKELIYPIVADRSKGSRIWDVDGNEYIDALNGFGSNFLGHAPELVTDALKQQIELGYEIGPMQPVVGECARLVHEITGNDRTAFCNTGSEAVMGAMRIARTVTGKSLIVIFSGSYHGIFDEVIVRGTRKLRSIPAAPGIMPSTVENVLVLDYGTPESLAIIKERALAGELAAVLIEPVQSRRPDFQPKEFLQELRKLTLETGVCYILDEVITGFRVHPCGAQHHFGVRADLVTYGKVVGGGMPFGVVSGKREWMDALDGGDWRFGDDSMPSVGVTYFAGTFVRHPLSMAAARATLLHIQKSGRELQDAINARTDRLANELNAFFAATGAPLKIKHFSSLWKAVYTEDHPMQDLVFCYLRDRGIHIWDGFPCFLTAAHSDADVSAIITAFKESVDEMQSAGFFPARLEQPTKARVFDAAQPPLPGARLGRDPGGDPAWFVPNPAEPGKYTKVEL